MAKIMIVDDAETFRLELKTYLKGGGHEIIEAADGKLGLEALAKNTNVQLIISDKHMPNMDGFEMCQKVKSMTEYKAVPIIMLTTEASHEMKAKGKEIGITYWLTKPYNPERLLTVIDKMIGKK